MKPLSDANNLLSQLRNDHKPPNRLSLDVVELRYGVGSKRYCKHLSLSVTANVVNLSKEGVRKIENKTISYLRSL